MLQKVMHIFERRFHARDIDKRISRPFEWGLEYLSPELKVLSAEYKNENRLFQHPPLRTQDFQLRTPLGFIRQFNAEAISDSDKFYSPPPSHHSDFEFDGFWLRFPSGITTPYEKNNRVHARFFPAGNNDRSVIVSPNWNAKIDSHIALCRLLNRFGISALRLSLPYHDHRMPDELTRADYMISANIGRTIQSIKQSVFDIRRAADWLFARGFKRVGVMGSSIGSCVSWLAFIHDERLQAGVFNMVSSWFGDVVWRALTTSHIRKVIEAELTEAELREAWLSISPSAFSNKLAGVRRPALLISARYDLTFLPDLAKAFFNDCERHRLPVRKVFLPCGHYTIGRTPFKYMDAWHIVNFFRKVWR